MNENLDAPWKANRDELYARAVSRGRFLQWRRRATIGGTIVVALVIPLAAIAAAAGGASHHALKVVRPHDTTTTIATSPTTTAAVQMFTATTTVLANTPAPSAPPTPAQSTPASTVPVTVTVLPDPCSDAEWDMGKALQATITFDASHVAKGDSVGFTATVTNPSTRIVVAYPGVALGMTSAGAGPHEFFDVPLPRGDGNSHPCLSGSAIGLGPGASYSFHGTVPITENTGVFTGQQFTGPATVQLATYAEISQAIFPIGGAGGHITIDAGTH